MKRLKYMLVVIATCIFVGCGDDNEVTETPKIDISNPDEVSNSITIENSSVVPGAPPAPSSDANAPALYDGSELNGAITGSSFYLTPELSQGEAAGVYLQIAGASEYYDIPFGENNTGGRFAAKHRRGVLKNLRTAEDEFVEIQIPVDLEPGTFCALYCVYDSENRVSNVVEVCIEIISFGGDGSEFFAGQSWEMVSMTESYDGESYTRVPGEDEEYTYQTDVPCGTGEYQTVSVTEVFRTNYFYINFSSSGSYGLEQEEYYKWLDYLQSDCQQLVYEEETEIYLEAGAWTYDQNTKTLTVVTEYNQDGEAYTDIFKVQIEKDGDFLFITQDEGLEGNFTLKLKKKV